MGTQLQFDALDIISFLSFLIGLENLGENRVQSSQNDVNAANDKQARQILSEIGKRLDQQEAMLKELLEVLHYGKNTIREEQGMAGREA